MDEQNKKHKLSVREGLKRDIERARNEGIKGRLYLLFCFLFVIITLIGETMEPYFLITYCLDKSTVIWLESWMFWTVDPDVNDARRLAYIQLWFYSCCLHFGFVIGMRFWSIFFGFRYNVTRYLFIFCVVMSIAHIFVYYYFLSVWIDQYN
jgi:hypothetical protein